MTFAGIDSVSLKNRKADPPAVSISRSRVSGDTSMSPGLILSPPVQLFRVPVTPDHSFEYMILGGWSEGAVNKTEEEFKKYTVAEALKYNSPPKITVHGLEKKE